MGNRAVITTEEKQIGIYVHWNGGRESIETFLAYCDLKNYRPPETDDYGWARMCQVIGNFFGGSTSIGIDKYERLDRDNYDNGVYIIENWKVIGREFQHYKDEEIKSVDDLEDNLNYLNEKQPKEEQLSKEEIHDYCQKWGIDRGLIEKEEITEEKDESKIKFYTEEEIKNLIEAKSDFYFADDGVSEVIIKFEDIPDFIVDYNRNLEIRDLKFFKMGKEVYEPDITTKGEFLDKIDPSLREKIIDRLIKLQQNEVEIKDYKVIDEDMFENVKSKLEQGLTQNKSNKEVR